MKTCALAIASILLLTDCTMMRSPSPAPPDLDSIAREYVRLVLAMGLHDADYVDAFYGPAEWRDEVRSSNPSLAGIEDRANELLRDLARHPLAPAGGAPPIARNEEDLHELRHSYLTRQLEALVARTEMLQGRKWTFDEQAEALYDAVPPVHTEAEFRAILDRLDAKLPGEGRLNERFERFRNQFVIPPDRLDRVFRAAVEGCRERTKSHIELPPDESFRLEYVQDKSWSGYNWYQGDFQSLIQVNTDLPIYIDRAIDLACHEGYPGHHVYNLLLEKELVKDRGWVEFSVYALFSPQSLIAEGTANFGIEVAFPADQRVAFEKSELFALAGLDPGEADRYYEILELVNRLSYAGNEAARRYLNGEIDAEQAAAWLSEFAMYSPDRARQRVRFMDQYGAYVINYNLGKDLVRRHVEALGGTEEDPARRWEIFENLISTPRLPSELVR